MIIGITLLVLGVIGYMLNIFLIKNYLDKRAPGVTDNKDKLPDGRQAWELTSGTGIVPKWVSLIGILGIIMLIIGLIIAVVSFFS